MSCHVKTIALAAAFFLSAPAFARTVRFRELSPKELASALSGSSDTTVAFEKGDRIPVHLKASGDLLVTEDDTPVNVRVQRGFYVHVDGGELLFSTDGADFAPLKDRVTGSLSAKASGDGTTAASGTAGRIDIELAAHLAGEH